MTFVKGSNVNPPARPPLELFMAKVDKRPNGCWIWTGCLNKGGYGLFTNGSREKKITAIAHRWLWKQLVGPIPKGHTLDHVAARGCTSKACVNPAHLEPVTSGANTLRSPNTMAAKHAAQTHCKRSHPLTGDNLAIEVRPNGRPVRRCRTCARAAGQRFRDRRRVAS